MMLIINRVYLLAQQLLLLLVPGSSWLSRTDGQHVRNKASVCVHVVFSHGRRGYY